MRLGLKALKGHSGVNTRSYGGCRFTAASGVGIMYMYTVTLSERLRMVDVFLPRGGSLRGYVANLVTHVWVTFSDCGELGLCNLPPVEETL